MLYIHLRLTFHIIYSLCSRYINRIYLILSRTKEIDDKKCLSKMHISHLPQIQKKSFRLIENLIIFLYIKQFIQIS